MHVPKPDMHGNREQGTWMRFHQVACSGPGMLPPCKLVGWPMYWDTYARKRTVPAQRQPKGGSCS